MGTETEKGEAAGREGGEPGTGDSGHAAWLSRGGGKNPFLAKLGVVVICSWSP